jgi:hypothetical protein
MLASSSICSAPTDTRSSACNSKLMSMMRKPLRKPQSLRRERSKRSTDVTGSCMLIRSRFIVNVQRGHQTFVPFGYLDALHLEARRASSLSGRETARRCVALCPLFNWCACRHTNLSSLQAWKRVGLNIARQTWPSSARYQGYSPRILRSATVTGICWSKCRRRPIALPGRELNSKGSADDGFG